MSKYMLVLHEVSDYLKWKPIYDETKEILQKNGLTNDVHLIKETKEKKALTLLFEIVDMKRALAFSKSKEMNAIIKNAGVNSNPAIYFLSDGSRSN